MIVASITITSQCSETIPDALRSVSDIADIMLLVDIGIDEPTLAAAREVTGDRLQVLKSNITLTCAEWRNAGLAEAARLGADWGIMLDTDMRLLIKNTNIREILSGADADYMVMWEDTGLYPKAIFFKLPFKGKYIGQAHETPTGCSNVGILDGVRFHELTKTKEQLQFRLINNDLPNLMKQINEYPEMARWRYYLGQTLENLEYYTPAISAYLDATNYGSREEKAWAFFRAAWCCYKLAKYEDAITHCAQGMGFDGKLAEFTYLSALCAGALNRFQDAECYARQAIPLGIYQGGRIVRGSFAIPVALWEGPFVVLSHLYPDDTTLKHHIENSKSMRLKWEKGM